MGKQVVVVGDSTTTGGKVITGQPSCFCDGHDVACIGDKVTCPACKGIGTIIEGEPTFNIHGKAVALDGYQIACGCPAGRNRLIAIHSRMFVEDTSRRQSQAQQQSRNTSTSGTGSGSSSYASSSRSSYLSAHDNESTNNKEPRKNKAQLVFAKSCLLGDDCTDAGTAKETASHFGELQLFKTQPTQNPSYYAAGAGVGALQLFGRQAATKGLSLATPRISLVNPGSVFLMGMLYSSEVGKGSDQIAAVHYEAMMKGTVSTRVRFFWGTGIDGIPRVYGHHVQGLQGDVRAKEMYWDHYEQRYESSSYDPQTPTIFWTPAGGVEVPSHTGHDRPPFTIPIFVYPIDDEIGKEMVTPPFPTNEKYNDFILIFPIDSGLPPLYIFISEKHDYYPAPQGANPLPAFPEAKRATPKTPVQGGGKLRNRWKDKKNIYEWDGRHGAVEKYNAQGKHLGEFNHKTGEQNKPADPTRRIEP